MIDVTAIQRNDTRRAIRLEAQTEAGWNWLHENAASVPGWWLFGGYDVLPEDGATLIACMRSDNLIVEC